MGGFFGRLIGVATAVVVVVAGFFFTFFVQSITVEAGHEVVIFDRPYFFGHEGARKEPLTQGRLLAWPTTYGVSVDVTPKTYAIKFDDLPTLDNSFLDFNTTIQVKVLDSVKLITGFREEWFVNNLQRPYEAAFRDISKAYTMPQIISDARTSAEIETKILKILNDKVKADGIPVLVMDFNMGQGRPNKTVVAQMDDTVAQEQAAKTYDKRKLAEDSRAESEKARALADKAYADKMGYSPEQLVELRAIDKYSEACAKSTCVIMSGGSVPMTLPAPASK
ncbi:SPFH domain-containing protein [Pseudomonas fluorescens]|uniref:SPFH domain-containing protein n=1 Tax=Pseudomonas TaxID=286 RepID=UPI000F01706F|nr:MULTISPECIES: SPFH domain-containing protein [Pseudomonas]MBD8089088.1 SPFH domain-containing protein [Pseudomonas fluorescens]MBD8615486.1 SPFH domain-containing protein [Pseudomonas putida]MBD8681861.1 SPFH domain-containing protein [Pseudomonas sp. CFBP 13719]